MKKFIWDKEKQIYIDEAGRRLTPTEFFALLETLVEKVEVRLAEHIERAIAEPGMFGIIQRQIQRELTSAHRMMGTLGWGGLEQMTVGARRAVDTRVRIEFGFMLRFSSELPGISQDAAVARVKQYAGASFATYDAASRESHTSAGYTHARWILDAGAEHCKDCPDQAARGVQPIAHFPAIGSLTCLNNCRCVLRYEKPETNESEVAA